MIVSRLNLVCAAGHRRYAPPRELPEWIGRDCLHGALTKDGKLAMRGRCLEKLRPMTVPEVWKFQRSTSPTMSEPSTTPAETSEA